MKGEEKTKVSGAPKNAAPTSSHSLSSGGQENGHNNPQSGRQPQYPTEAEAKRLCRLIVAHANEKFDITFTASNTRDLLAGIRETPVAPDGAWLFAVAKLVYQLDHADNDRFARSQAAGRLAATLPTKFVPVKKNPDNSDEKPTCVIDRYYEHKVTPFLMEIVERQIMEKAEREEAEWRLTLPENRMTGVSGETCLTCLARSSPFIPGIIRSVNTRSMPPRRKTSRARSPAVQTIAR